jgi:DNA-binding beta-propeller fold protein YncE
MKLLGGFFLLILCAAFGQNDGSGPIGGSTDVFAAPKPIGAYYLRANYQFTYVIYRNPDGSKTFVFSVLYCVADDPQADSAGFIAFTRLSAVCTEISRSEAVDLAPVQEAIGDFLNDASDVPHHIVYAKSSEPARLSAKLAPRAAPAAPSVRMTLLDTLSTDRIATVDLKTFAIVQQVNLPDQATLFAIRPSAAGPTTEVWTGHASGANNLISIADLSTGKLAGTIQTSTLAPNGSLPAGLVFTNDGATALYAVRYFNKDSAGNLGALLTYDAASRKLTSTMPLTVAPTSLLMAPDGLTAYIIGGQTGTITYYDVLSGTADLTVTRVPLNGPAFIHPDGTRLFWDAGQLEVFDLTARKIVNEFKFGLPTTSATSMTLSQDGSQAYIGNGAGAVVVMDTRYGNILATFQAPGAAQAFSGPPAN